MNEQARVLDYLKNLQQDILDGRCKGVFFAVHYTDDSPRACVAGEDLDTLIEKALDIIDILNKKKSEAQE
jgi:hypothetical protein